jgi:hypothetical protein
MRGVRDKDVAKFGLGFVEPVTQDVPVEETQDEDGAHTPALELADIATRPVGITYDRVRRKGLDGVLELLPEYWVARFDTFSDHGAGALKKSRRITARGEKSTTLTALEQAGFQDGKPGNVAQADPVDSVEKGRHI